MQASALGACAHLPVPLACTPRQHCSAVSAALFPLPLAPEMKVMCGPNSMDRWSWHMKFTAEMRRIWPAEPSEHGAGPTAPASSACKGAGCGIAMAAGSRPGGGWPFSSAAGAGGTRRDRLVVCPSAGATHPPRFGPAGEESSPPAPFGVAPGEARPWTMPLAVRSGAGMSSESVPGRRGRDSGRADA